MFKILVLSLALLATILPSLGKNIHYQKVSKSLKHSLETNGFADVVVSFPSTIPILESIEIQKFSSRTEKLNAIVTTLKAHATNTQAFAIQLLKSEKTSLKYQSYWINNRIIIKNAYKDLIHSLSEYPDVLEIRQELKGKKFPPFNPVPYKRVQNSLEWGIERIQVQKAWEKGINGTGIVVAILDSGVSVTHESLRDNFLGEFGWFAPGDLAETPNDWSGHGTHVMGTIVGKGGIGVAPGAKFMACQLQDYAEEGHGNECGQFILCPHLFDGSNEDCSKAPDVVSNSWGYPEGGNGNTYYEEVLKAWETGEISIVFSAGNDGPSCDTLASPGDSQNPAVITVGATNIANKLSDFSSVGPSVFGQIKPNIVAPGEDILSADDSSDSGYVKSSGTSMAAPHVAGVVALIKSSNPKISTQEIRERIYKNAMENIIGSTESNCGDVPESSYPNNHVGHGLLSATAAL